MPTLGTIHEQSQFLEAFEFGLSEVYEDAYKVNPVTYPNWISQKSAKAFWETEWVVSGLGVMAEKAIGGPATLDKIISGPTVRHDMKTWAMSVAFEYEVFAWDLYGIFEPVIKSMPDSAKVRMELLAYRALNEAFATSLAAYQTFQGETICSTAHSRLDGGTWSNSLTTGLSYTGLEEASILLRKLVNERGMFAMASADRLVVPEELQWTAKTLLQTTGRPGTADNDINVAKTEGYGPEPFCSPYILTDTYWFLLGSKDKIRMGMRIGERPNLKFKDRDVRTLNLTATSYMSCQWYTVDSRGLVGSTGGS